jgi:ParB family chromosome partitioning protein
MSRRRRDFQIGLPEAAVPAGNAPAPRRRGPMASAIAESAEAARARAETEAEIRAENDRLAAEHVRLRRLGLVFEPVALEAIRTTRLRRDRSPGPDPELDDLVASIRAVGLSNPIRVERAGEGVYELVQGRRRLEAYRRLHAETADAVWAAIPAAVMAPGESLSESYRRMVDENMVRRDISFAEMATLARAFAADPEIPDCGHVTEAVDILYGSAGAQKRSYIRAFAELLDMLEPHLSHPEAIPRNLGLAVRRQISEGNPGLADLVAALRAHAGRGPEAELSVLRGFVGEGGGREPPAGPAARPAPGAGQGGRLRLDLEHARGPVRLTAGQGRVELRAGRDFARLPEERLARAVRAFLAALED